MRLEALAVNMDATATWLWTVIRSKSDILHPTRPLRLGLSFAIMLRFVEEAVRENIQIKNSDRMLAWYNNDSVVYMLYLYKTKRHAEIDCFFV